MKSRFSTLLLPALAAAISFVLLSCEKDKPEEPVGESTGRLSLNFDHVAGARDLTLNTVTYKNGSGEDFTVSKLTYFVSNIKLTRADGTAFVVPQDSSYFLVRESDAASQTISLNHVPEGNYTGVEFIVGVDSLKSVAEASDRKGILDIYSGPVNEDAMYWDWNPGYIFLKIEGKSPVATTPNESFYYHIGGFGGRTTKTINNLRTVKLSFGPAPATGSAGQMPAIGITVDILKIFDGPTKLSIQEHSGVMYEDFSGKIADNYTGMFTFKSISNFYQNK